MINQQVLKLGFLLIALSTGISHGQQIRNEEEFDYKKQFLIHELQWLKPVDSQSFILLEEIKKSRFNLTYYTSELHKHWSKKLEFDNRWNVPQLFVAENKLLVLCYNIDESNKLVTILARYFNLENGEILAEHTQTLVNYSKKGPYPKFALSKDLNLIGIYNYANDQEQMEAAIFEINTGNALKKFEVDLNIDNTDVYQNAMVENNGNMCLVYADPTFFRLSSAYFSIDQTEPVVIESGMVFTRPMDEVASIKLNQVAVGTYRIAAAGKLNDDLIGVKVAEYNFPNYQISYDTIQNFNIQYFYYLYKKDLKANPVVKKSSLKEPWRLKNYHLQHAYVDKYDNTILLLEKNQKASEYYLSNNNRNLEYIYNTSRKLQKSEDIIVMAFDKGGQLHWDHVLQKRQATRPFNFYTSFVAGLDDGVLNFVTWSKKGEASIYVNSLKTIDGTVVRSQVPIMPGVNHTYHKNYTAWLNQNQLLITSQKRNKKTRRKLQVIEFAPVNNEPITAEKE